MASSATDIAGKTTLRDSTTSLDRFRLRSGPTIDRLPPMLFLAALIHGILIIGITFNAALDESLRSAISLEVTIVADPENTVDAALDAEYLAQASQEGAGNTTEASRPRAPALSNMPIDNVGVDEGNSLQELTANDRAADQLLTTRAEQAHRTPDNPRQDPEQQVATAIALESGVDATLALPRDELASVLIRDDNPRQLVTSVNTREAKIAGYLDRWKRKIEGIGISYFPDSDVTEGMTGSPILEVTIDASGDLQEVIVRETSGSRVLDQAALNILRRAAPFDPFPEAVRIDYDQLRFAYKWQFSSAETAAAASVH